MRRVRVWDDKEKQTQGRHLHIKTLFYVVSPATLNGHARVHRVRRPEGRASLCAGRAGRGGGGERGRRGGEFFRHTTIARSSLRFPHANPPSQNNHQAYGPTGLGILTVAGIPGLDAARSALLPLAHTLASLPPSTLASLEDPPSRYNFGWSHGREALSDGRLDTAKGSFYANPLRDGEGDRPPSAESVCAFPTVARPNVWPETALPALRPAFVDLGTLLAGVGQRVAAACDAVAARARRPSEEGGGPPPALASLIASGDAAKGRLLYYFPRKDAGDNTASTSPDSWCGWHADHGLLTALTRALYVNAATGAEVPDPPPSSNAGLYIRPRGAPASAPPIRITIPPSHAAFQAGEAAQVASGGAITATPHCVRPPAGEGAQGIARATFALFLQPRWDAVLAPPPGVEDEEVGVARWKPGDNFGAFSERTVDAYYG